MTQQKANITLALSGTAGFTSVDEARAVGQAIKKLFESADSFANGAFVLTEVPAQKRIALVKPTFDRSKSIVGFQEAEANASSFAKEIDKRATDLSVSTADYWGAFISGSKATGIVDNNALVALASERLGEDATEVIIEITGAIAANAIARVLRKPKPKNRP